MNGISRLFELGKKATVTLTSLSMVLALCTSCTKKEDEGKLAVFHGFEKDDVKTWDPANAYDSVSLDLVPSVYETLYQYSYLSDVYKLEPLLAAEMPRYSA